MVMIEFSFTEVGTETKEDIDPQGCDACMYCELMRQAMQDRAAETPERAAPSSPSSRNIGGCGSDRRSV
jgi:hypothetical protein